VRVWVKSRQCWRPVKTSPGVLAPIVTGSHLPAATRDSSVATGSTNTTMQGARGWAWTQRQLGGSGGCQTAHIIRGFGLDSWRWLRGGPQRDVAAVQPSAPLEARERAIATAPFYCGPLGCSRPNHESDSSLVQPRLNNTHVPLLGVVSHVDGHGRGHGGGGGGKWQRRWCSSSRSSRCGAPSLQQQQADAGSASVAEGSAAVDLPAQVNACSNVYELAAVVLSRPNRKRLRRGGESSASDWLKPNGPVVIHILVWCATCSGLDAK
jgi:hypothetical protein